MAKYLLSIDLFTKPPFQPTNEIGSFILENCISPFHSNHAIEFNQINLDFQSENRCSVLGNFD